MSERAPKSAGRPVTASGLEAPGSPQLHPLQNPAGVGLPTMALEAFVNDLRMWLDNLLPGGLVTARPRYGKTTGVRYVRENVADLFDEPIPTLLCDCDDGTVTKVTEKKFYEGMLRKLGYAKSDAGTAAQKKARLIGIMSELSLGAGVRRFMLFMDEAQHLGKVQYSYLVNLQNELEDLRVGLFTVLVGQPELRSQRETYRSRGQTQITGRFMTAVHVYGGIATLGDLAYLCDAIDSKSEWPAGSGLSYSHYYAPKAYESGWRLGGESALIWQIINEQRRERGLSTTRSLTTQAIMSLLRWILKTSHDLDRPDMELDADTVREGYLQAAAIQIEDDLTAPADPVASGSNRG